MFCKCCKEIDNVIKISPKLVAKEAKKKDSGMTIKMPLLL